MNKKIIYQLGMEPQYAAHVLMLWNEGEYPCDIRVRRARTEGLIIVEVENLELANKITNATRCKVAVKEVEQKYIPKENFEYNGYNIMNYKDINELFLKTYSNYNFKNRINEIEKHLATEFRKKSKEIIENLKNQRTRAIENLQGEKRIQVFEQYAKEIEMVEKKYMKIIKEYLNKIQNKDCIEYSKNTRYRNE